MDYHEIIALSVMAGLAFLYSCFKKGIADMITKYFQSWFKEKFEGEAIDKEFNSVYERLVELKTRLNADRVFINQFHNGSVFSNNKSIWKLSRSYEVCASGVSYESLNVQNILAVSVWDSLSALFDNKTSGYYKKIKGGVCAQCKAPFGVYIYNVDKMPESFSKVCLRNHGVKTYIQIPLIQFDAHIVGYVGIEFLDSFDELIDPCFICQKVQEIEYFLNKG